MVLESCSPGLVVLGVVVVVVALNSRGGVGGGGRCSVLMEAAGAGGRCWDP